MAQQTETFQMHLSDKLKTQILALSWHGSETAGAFVRRTLRDAINRLPKVDEVVKEWQAQIADRKRGGPDA
jgi:hypothetical protein